MKRYTYKEVDDWLLTELQAAEVRAEALASRLGVMSDDDPHQATVAGRWQEQELLIDAISMLRRHFSDYDRKQRTDVSHDLTQRRATT